MLINSGHKKFLLVYQNIVCMSDRRSHSSRHSGMEFGRNRGPRLSSNVKNVQRDQHYQGMFTDSERAQWDYYGQSQERRERDQNNFIHPQPKQE